MTKKINVKTISRLPDDLILLVQHSEKEGFAFVRRLWDEWHDGSNRFNNDGEFLMVATSRHQSIGVCGVNIDPYVNNTDTARLRHLYVLPEFRSDGSGSALVRSSLNRLHQHFKTIRLRVPNAETGMFYEKFGFQPVSDKNSTHVLRVDKWELPPDA